MATSSNVSTLSLIAGAAFVEADFGKVVEVSGVRTVTLANATTDTVAGVLAMAPAAIGDTVPVAELSGIIKVQAGGNITAGQILVPAADGQVTGVADINALGANVMGIGIALEAGVAGQIIEAIGMPLTSAASA